MRAVNLLPADAAQRKSFLKEDPAVVVGSALGAVVLIALAAGFLNVHSKVSANNAQLAAVRTQLAKLSEHKQAIPPTLSKPAYVQPIVPMPTVMSEQQPRLDALSSAMSTRIAWDRILREFSLVLPSDVTLASLSLTAPLAVITPGAVTHDLQLSGTTYSYDAVAGQRDPLRQQRFSGNPDDSRARDVQRHRHREGCSRSAGRADDNHHRN